MLRLCWLVLCLAAASYSAPSPNLEIKEFAVPSAVKIGENAELQCLYSSSQSETATFFVKWWWTPLSEQSDKRHAIYQRVKGGAPTALHHNTITIKPNDTIELLNLQPKDSGIYECEVSDIFGEDHKRHELIVYTGGSGPHLNTSAVPDGPDNDSEDDVLIECSATDVAPMPDLVVTVDGEEILLSENLTEPIDGLYDIYGTATISKEYVKNKPVRCELYFENKDVAHEAYFDVVTYEDPGAMVSTTEAADVVTEEESSTITSPIDGSASLSFSWVLLVTLAVMAHLGALL